jgi:hypothetical protein
MVNPHLCEYQIEALCTFASDGGSVTNCIPDNCPFMIPTSEAAEKEDE